MKRLLAVVGLMAFLTGCGAENSSIDGAVSLRNSVLRCNQCSFNAQVTADYGDSLYTFGMDCEFDSERNMSVTVTAPETISGITARVSKGTGQLTFDDKALTFALLADGVITPISVPWLFMEALTGGYISACGKDGAKVRIQIDDTFSEAQFHVDIWTKGDGTPERGEIVWQGRRIVSIEIKDFVIV